MDAEDQVTLRNYYDNFKNTNLVILACKDNKVKILEHLLCSNNNVSVGNRGPTILPHDEDETCHNAFYYAIRSGNVELLDTLINKWPENYFAVRSGELDEILSRAYEELKLKNVLLSEEIEIFVENELINLRFFADPSEQDRNMKGINNLNNTRKRIELVLQNITLLKAEYSNTKKVDGKFLFVSKFVAQNIHILKQQLKSTYDRLPWEEIEFSLVSFVSSYIKRQEINLFYHATLSKSKILNHLENFVVKLKNTVEGAVTSKFTVLPNLKREKIVAEIVSNYPQFGELYSDYQQIRDVHSLEKISNYIKLALSADPKQREGQLIITRALQVIGENLKNTLESPKLSSTTSELLLLSLPKNTRKVIMDLRNSLSHANSLSKRTEIEENRDVNFYIGVQNDTKRVDNVITEILYNNKIKMIRILLKKINNSESLDEIKEIAEVFRNVELNLDKMITKSYKVIEHEKLEKFIKEMSNIITDKTYYENELFAKINNIINNFAETKSEIIRTDYITSFKLLQSLVIIFFNNKIDHNVVKTIKFFSNKILENATSQIEPHNLKEIAELSMQIYHGARSRIQNDSFDKVNRLTCEIFYIAEFGTNDLKWIERLRDKLKEKGSFIPIHKQKKAHNITEEKYNNQLALKLSELNGILGSSSEKFIEGLPSYKKNKKRQAVVEMLVLDIMSILGTSKKHLENNQHFLDDNTPLLTGKCLRNHLAHDNILVNVLLSDPSLAIVLNAKKLISENISFIKSTKKVGKFSRDDPFKLKDKYDQSIITITNQEKMFAALEKGNLKDLTSYLQKGADINARSINSSTALHFAARGPSLEVIQFIIDQKLAVNVKDVKGQSPLHIAAAHGRKHIVEFFVCEEGSYVDDLDNSGKTPLHIAAKNGHKDTVEALLKNNANANAKDKAGHSPLHYAIRNNHIDVSKIMLKKEANVDINETMGGFTPLHIAAEMGFLELVIFLLRNEANVNARNEMKAIPLHTAALNGHLEVVNALIFKGADVNSRAINGFTPLHCAIENGHEKVAYILLKHGADVNTIDKICNNTPLHFAAKYGHEEIVMALLNNMANASIATVEGITPLHFAVKNGHLNIVSALLEYGVNICAKDKNNNTPLHHAAESGHKAVAELLIQNGAEINDKANNDLTPLHVAALNGHNDIIELLIRNKADVRAEIINGSTPLHVTALNGSIEVIDLLIKNKAEVNARANNGMTPLHVAARSGHGDAVAFLIRSKAEVNNRADYGFTPLHLAIAGAHKDIVNLLIRNEANVNVEGVAPLHLAVEAGNKEIVEILVANRANVNVKSDNLTPLISAIKHNHVEIVEVLVKNGADVNAEGGKPLSWAVLAGYRDIFEILLKHMASINMKGPEDITLLHLAAECGDKQIVSALITKGAKVDAMTINGTTPLYHAAQEGHKEVVELLIVEGANVNVLNVNGTPLHIAARHGHDNVAEVLLNNGAKINVKDDKNRTPLELAVAHGHLQVVKMLLQYKKVDVNAKGNDGWTILHIASQASNLEMIECLVSEGSNINAENVLGSKPIHIAAREGFKCAVEFFLSKGLSINELGAANQTLLHYAAMNGQLDVAKYLIAQGAAVNAADKNGATPMHIAAESGYRDVIEVLLKNGAIFNAVDKFYRTPLEMTNNQDVINLLTSIDKLHKPAKLALCHVF